MNILNRIGLLHEKMKQNKKLLYCLSMQDPRSGMLLVGIRASEKKTGRPSSTFCLNLSSNTLKSIIIESFTFLYWNLFHQRVLQGFLIMISFQTALLFFWTDLRHLHSFLYSFTDSDCWILHNCTWILQRLCNVYWNNFHLLL